MTSTTINLYKYIDSVRPLRPILEGVCKFTPVRELNDPSEMVPQVIVEEVRASLAHFRRAGYSASDILELQRQERLLWKLAPHIPFSLAPDTADRATAQIRSPAYDNVDSLVETLRVVATEFADRVGVFSLTQRYDSLPMWAHYSSNARGFVVEYGDLNTAFAGDDTGVLNQLLDVQYTQSRTGVTFDPVSHKSLFLSKLLDWSYEKEVRVVRALADCEFLSLQPSQIFIHRIPGASIKRIILGWNMSEDDKATVRRLVHDVNPSVRIVSAAIKNGRAVVVT